MQLSTAEARRIFRKLTIEPKKSKHHVAGWLVVDGRRVLLVRYSYGKKDLRGNVPQRFRQSLHLGAEEFSALKRCTMTRDEYIALLRERGVL